MQTRKKIFILAVVAVFFLLGAAAFGFFVLSGRLPTVDAPALDLSSHPSFRTWDEHHEIYSQGDFPYVVELEHGEGALLYMGVLHTTDPEHPQFALLREMWAEFAPTVALNEGRARYFRWGSEFFGGISDAKLPYLLARTDGIPVYSLEPSYEDEVAILLEKWPADLVACFFATRVIAAESGGDDETAEAIAPGFIAKRTDVEGLRGTLNSLADLDRVWLHYVPAGPGWRSVTNIDSVPVMRDIGDDSREARGAHMVRSIAHLVSEGERVLAVVGASHVIRHEPTVRSLLSFSP